jgi:PAS domain S-box-containing protein
MTDGSSPVPPSCGAETGPPPTSVATGPGGDGPAAAEGPRERLRALLEANPCAAWAYDASDSRIVEANERALRQYGYAREAFIGLTISNLEPDPQQRPPERDPPLRTTAVGSIRRHRRSDGTILTVRLEVCDYPVPERPLRVMAAVDITEFAASEQRYRQLFEIASDWFWECAPDARITYVSENIEAMLGVPVSSYIGKPLISTEGFMIDPELVRDAVVTILARQPFRDIVYSRRLPSGRVAWFSTSGSPFFGPDGSFQGYRGIAKDVTAKVEAERALRESERQFRQVLEAAADYYWEQDAEYRMSYLSPSWEALMGLSSAEQLGKRLNELPDFSMDAAMVKMVVEAYTARQPFRDLVHSVKMPDGRIRWFKVSGAPMFDRAGAFRGYRGVGAEITRRVETEATIRLAHRRLHEALAHVTQPIVVYDADDRAIAFNQAFTDLHTALELVTPLYENFSFRSLSEWQLGQGFYADGPEDSAVDLEMLLDRYQSGSEHAYHLRDGRWMLVSYRRLPGGGRVGLWTDVTAIKRADAERRAFDAELQHSQRLEALGTLAGGVAHEINNALVPVIALTKLMGRKAPEGSRERQSLDTVLAGAERSRDLVKQILAFSRKEELRREGVDLGAVLRTALRLMRATLPASIRLEDEIAPTPPVIGDKTLFQQVIVNLMTNAAQAIGSEQGRIAVSLGPEADGTELRLSVVDTGCGMDEPTKARIFEPFFTTKQVGEGTGLGLSVVHGIVKEHGGRIEVTSAPGRGSRFDVLLPARHEATPGTAY